MCDKRNTTRVRIQGKTIRVDACLKNIIEWINSLGIKTVASCCGHGEYFPSILVQKESGIVFDIYSDRVIPRTRNFYKTDDKGFYFIPETPRRYDG